MPDFLAYLNVCWIFSHLSEGRGNIYHNKQFIKFSIINLQSLKNLFLSFSVFSSPNFQVIIVHVNNIPKEANLLIKVD